MSPPRGIREIWLRLKKTGTDVRREVDGLHVDVFAPSISADIGWESGKAFSGSGIWPKYGVGIGKMINILTAPREVGLAKIWAWDAEFFGGIHEIVTTQVNFLVAKEP